MTSEKSSLIRDGFPKVRRVVRRNGTVAYRVDCRTKGWLGQQTYEYATRNEALEKARVIAKDAETQGVGVTSASLHLAHSDEYAELTQKLAPHGKTIRDAVDYYLQHLEENRLREGSLRLWRNPANPTGGSGLTGMMGTGGTPSLPWTGRSRAQ